MKGEKKFCMCSRYVKFTFGMAKVILSWENAWPIHTGYWL